MKILAADDLPLILKSIGHKLHESGYEMLFAENGQEAIDLFDKEHPDLAIIDLNMPIKSGIEVIEHIRQTRHSMTPIIVMSGNDEEDTIVQTFNLGVDDYIEKPVGINEVLVRIKRLLKEPNEAIKIETKLENKPSPVLQKRSVGVIIPCYNEGDRLSSNDFTDFVYSNVGYNLCFVNDGSKDNTLEVLNKLRIGHEDSITVYNCEENGGKAEAVRLGILHLLKDPNIEYFGYLDADLSTDFLDYEDLVKTIETTKFKIVSGSRISRMGANITKQWGRKIISNAINKTIRLILGMSFQDTQCGAKVMTREIASHMFNEKFITRWLFDVEIFMRMKKYFGADTVQDLICEQPLNRWVHADGSKVSMKDSLKIIFQLLEIYIHYR